MILTDREEAHHRVGRRTLPLPGWQVHLAAFGDGSARPTPWPDPTAVILREAPRERRASGTPVVGEPLVELRMAPGGTVVAHCTDAPPALLVHACTEPAHPLLDEASSTLTRVRTGDLLFACTPSFLDALDPAHVVALPRLLWMSPEPDNLLLRWITAANRHGMSGAAAMVARRIRQTPPMS